MTIKDIKKLKKETEKLTTWESSKQAFGHLKNIEIKSNDRIYEFYCLLRILADLRSQYNIKLIPGIKNNKIFPLAPAKKGGWSRFDILPKNRKRIAYQVCFGTNIKISISPQTTIAPDISFQNINATDDPDETMIYLVMDAKYKSDKSSSLDISLIREFKAIVSDLDITGANTTDLLFNSLKGLKANCLITNGKTVNSHKQYCINNGIKQIGDFRHSKTNFIITG